MTWYFLRVRDRRRQRQSGNMDARAHLEKLRQTEPMRHDMDALKVEIEQMARRMATMLDNKADRIEALLDEADQTLAKLQQAKAEAAAMAAMQPAAKPAAAMDASERMAPRAPHASVPPQTKQPMQTPPHASAARPASGAASMQASADQPWPGERKADPLTEKVVALYKTGMPAEAIAKELDEYIGKVELILSLNRA